MQKAITTSMEQCSCAARIKKIPNMFRTQQQVCRQYIQDGVSVKKRTFGSTFVDYTCISVKLACSSCCYSRSHYNIMCSMHQRQQRPFIFALYYILHVPVQASILLVFRNSVYQSCSPSQLNNLLTTTTDHFYNRMVLLQHTLQRSYLGAYKPSGPSSQWLSRFSCHRKPLGVFLSHLDAILVHHGIYPQY